MQTLPAPPPPPRQDGAWTEMVAPGLVLVNRIFTDGASFDVMRIASGAHLKLYRSGAMSAEDSANAIAAFNGGFNPADAGGQTGFSGGPGVIDGWMAAVVAYGDGGFGLGQWGRDVPDANRPLAWVRSNLQLLVDGGAPTAAASNPQQWGVPLSSVGLNTARSALGIDADGNLLYVASRATYPGPLANALVAVGAQRAMELDINPWWVRAFAYPGGNSVEVTQNPNNPGDHFRNGWDRDFFVVTRP